MTGVATLPTTDLRRGLLETYAVNERINQLILEHLDPRAWRAKPPGRNARAIAVIFAHIHNVRRKWLRLSARHLRLPAQLDRTRCTQQQVRAALAESADQCQAMIQEALAGSNGRVKQFVRDGWSRPWVPGVAMLTYMVVHEAHHRGQVCMLAHQMGYPLPIKVGAGMWYWEKLWKDCGFGNPR